VLQARLAALPQATPAPRESAAWACCAALLLAEEPRAQGGRQARELGLLVNAIGDRVLRLAPPLTVSESEIHEGTKLLAQAIAQA